MANPRLQNGLASPQSVFEISTVKNHALGSKGFLGNRVFYYASSAAAGALAINSLCIKAASVANHVAAVWASGGVSNTDTVAITLGATSAAANLYADGWIVPADGTGQGQSRVIKNHTSASSSGVMSLTVMDPFTVSFAASAEIGLVKNRFDSVIISPGNAIGDVVGANQVEVPIGSTTVQYFWIQTWGPAMITGDGATYANGSSVTQAISTTADAGQITVIVGLATTVAPALVIGDIIEIVSAASDGDARFVDMKLEA